MEDNSVMLYAYIICYYAQGSTELGIVHQIIEIFISLKERLLQIFL
jgi:hypothetical protein